MALDYDATSKYLVETDPMGWIRFFGLPGTSAYTKDVDISTVSGAGDIDSNFYLFGTNLFR